MADLTVVILTKNEENNLRKCIDSFNGVAKRFVIVDSFSTDGTKELCLLIKKELKSSSIDLDFYENKWISYSNQFNWGLDNTNINTKWTMRMDADEELLPQLAKEIENKLSSLDDSIGGIVINRRLIFMGKWIKHGGRYPERILRIFKTGKARCEMKLMDEHMILSEGKTVNFENDLIDNNTKSLEWWTAKHNWYSNREVQDYQALMSNSLDSSINNNSSSRQAKIKRIVKNSGYYKLPSFFRAHIYFIYRYYFRLGFLDGKEGKIFHFLQAYWYRFLVDAKIYECEKTGLIIKPQGDLKA